MVDVTSRLRLVVDSTGVDKAGRKLRDIERGAKRATDQAQKLQNAFRGVVSALGGLAAVSGIVSIADGFTQIENRLRLVTSGTTDLTRTMEALGDIARSSQSDLDSTITLFSRIEQFAGTAFESQQQALDFTKAIQNSFLAAGASAKEAQNAVRQLTQGLASGELRGEEFRSVAEQAPLLAKAITDAVGDGTKSAFELAREGAFTTEVVVDAVLSKINEFQSAADNIAPTIGRSLQILRNEIILVFGQDVQRGGQAFAEVILFVADNLETLRPKLEGAAAAVLALGTAFAAPAIAAGLATLLSPLGLLAAGIAAVVAFRDDIAEWAFGVRDAGAVVQASFDVLGPRIQKLGDEIAAFAAASYQTVLNWGNAVASVFNDFRARTGQIIPPQALESVKRFAAAVVDVFVNLAKSIAELLTDAILFPIRAVEGLYRAIGNIDLLPDGVQAELRAAADAFKTFTDNIDANAGGETVQAIGDAAKAVIDGVKSVATETVHIYGEIKSRAEEIVAERNAAVGAEESATRAIQVTQESVNRLAQSYRDMKAEAMKASAEIAKSLNNSISGFGQNVSRANLPFSRNGPQIAGALQQQFEQLVRDIDDLSIGLAPEDLEEVYENLREVGVYWNEELEDAARTGALGLGKAIRQAIEDGASAFAAIVSGFAQAGRDIIGGLDGALGVLRDPNASFSNKLFGGIESIGGSIADALSKIPGLQQFAPIAEAISQVAGFFNDAIDFFKRLFGSQSSGATFNLSTGGSSFGRSGPFDEAIAGFGDKFSQLAKQFADLLGASISDALGIRFFIDRNQSILPSVRNLSNNALVALPAGATTDSRGVTTDPEEAIRLALGLTLENLFEGVDQTLADITSALLQSGVAFDDIISTIEQFKSLTDVTAEPLSEYERQIAELNKTFDAALENVRGVAAAEEKLIAARERAIEAVVDQFDADIQGQIDDLLDGPLDRLNKLLRDQEKRAQEAERLGGDLDQVARLSALELREFFEGLTDQALDEVRDFLGLFEEASATVLRNLDLSRQDLRAQADSFGQFAQDFANLRTQLNERFIAASPRESLDILRARATGLLDEVRGGNASAAQALPQVLNQLVENARQTFGNTQGFTDVFSFVQSILNEAEAASLNIQSEAERQIAALDENNDILADIRDILSRAEATSAFYQSFVSGGIASSDDLLRLIQEGAGLSFAANDNASALNITGLIAQSVTPIVQPVASSIDTFTQRLSDMPNLLRIQIDATAAIERAVDVQTSDLGDKLDRLEVLQKKMLQELEEAA